VLHLIKNKSASLLCSLRLSRIFLLVVQKFWIWNMRVTATTTVSAVQTVLSVPPNHQHRWDWLHRTGLFRIFRYLTAVICSVWPNMRWGRQVLPQRLSPVTNARCVHPRGATFEMSHTDQKPRVKNTNNLLKDRWVSAGWYTWQSIWTSYVHLIHYPPAVQWQTCASPAATSGISAFAVQCAKRLPTALAACYSVCKEAQCSS